MKRPQNDFMDSQIGMTHDVLDHGYIKVLDYMGDEKSIAFAARTSYGKGTKTVHDDAGLIRRLLRHWHTSPFEMAEIKIEVKMPIFVARQWIRHRTASVNEYSGRYSKMIDEFYIPERDRVMGQSATNKQGSDGVESEYSFNFIDGLDCGTVAAKIRYECALESGIARETARIGLPVNQYTVMVWKIDVHNLLHFLMLRSNQNAQWEIQQYANVLCDIVKGWMPNLWDAFEDYRLNSVTLSGKQTKLLQKAIQSICKGFDDFSAEFIQEDAQELGMSKGEIRETLEKFKRLAG